MANKKMRNVMLTKFTFAVGLCTLITLGCSQGNTEQGKKEATIRHLSKSVEYDKKATAIINKGNEYSIMNTKDSEEMIRFLRITLEEAKQVDIGILNSEVPGWGAKFRDEYIEGLSLILKGHETANIQLSIEGQKKAADYKEWFNREKRKN
jgi:hypothetical protein